MYTPSLEQVKVLSERGNLIPIYREILADLETPVSAFMKVWRGNGSFLLESVEGGERMARYSFIGTEPRLVARFNQGDAEITSTDADGTNRTEHRTIGNPLNLIR